MIMVKYIDNVTLRLRFVYSIDNYAALCMHASWFLLFKPLVSSSTEIFSFKRLILNIMHV